jgi:hypothetical protein
MPQINNFRAIEKYLAVELDFRAGELIKKLHQGVIDNYLPADIKSGTAEYQLWNDKVREYILFELDVLYGIIYDTYINGVGK